MATPAYLGATRRHSLFGTEDRIILDIGSKVSKFGFSGEPKPRIIIDSLLIAQPTQSSTSSNSSLSPSQPEATSLWHPDIERCSNDKARKEVEALLLARLTQLLRTAFNQYLMVDPKQRKVIVVENPLMPTLVKEMVCKVLFSNLQVPSVSFLPSHLLSLVASGRITGLVIECGHHETTIVPVYYARPLIYHSRSSPRAGKRLNRRLRALMLRFGKYIPPAASFQGSGVPAKQRAGKIPEAILTDDFVELVKTKALLVGPYDSALSEHLVVPTDAPTKHQDEVATDKASQRSVDPTDVVKLLEQVDLYDEAEDDSKMQSLNERYSGTSRASALSVVVPSRINEAGRAAVGQSSFLSSSSSLHLNFNLGAGAVVLPGWVRERAAEILFESEDDEDSGLVDMAVDVIMNLPIDLRRSMCESILITGGTAMLPGMINRFRTQLTAALEKAERNRRAAASLSKVQSGTNKLDAPGTLHTSIAVMNDPWPLSSKTDSGRDLGGHAPAFPANLLTFVGASLAGLLKTSALSEVTREAYDEALSAVERLREAGDEGTGAIAAESNPSRPLMGAGNRGSFVGVVGGLETGAFGALAAVSRHLVHGRATTEAGGGNATAR